MKKQKVKSETGKKAENDVASSRLTSQVSRSSVTFFNHVSHSLSHSFIHILCIVFLVLIIYSNTLNAPFQWDENGFIVNNPIVKNLHYFTAPSDAKGFERYGSFVNRYIGYLTFALNYRIHGLSVTSYHIVNIAIHIANSVLVYLFVLLTFRTPFFKGQGSRVRGQELKAGSQSLERGSQSLAPKFVAFFSAALFAVHPLQTEAVTYVFQRFASLVTFFYLLSLVFYIKARIGNNVLPFSRFTFFTFYGLSILSAVLAMKTKENAFTLPIVIALYEFCFFNSSSLLPLDKGRMGGVTRRLLYLVPILLTLLIIPLTLMDLGNTAGMGTHQLHGPYIYAVFSRGEYFLTEVRVIVTYLRLLFFPVDQNLNYDYPLFTSFFDLPVLLSFVFLFLLFGLGVWLIIGNRLWAIGNGTKTKDKENDPLPSSRFSGLFSRFTNSRCFGSTSHVSRPLVSRPLSDLRPFRLMGFGILWFFITLSVESSIIPIPMLIDEYRMYLPSVGMIICVVTGAFWVFSPKVGALEARFTAFKRFTVVTPLLIVGVMAVATYQRNELWGDKIRLWEDTARKSPAKITVHYTLGTYYQEKNLPYKAMEQYLIAVRMDPYFTDAHHNLGLIYKSLNMFDKAMNEFQIDVTLMPTDAEAHNNLGIIYKSLNMFDKAMEQYLTAIKLKPDYMEAHYNLGNIYLEFNMPDKAMEQYLIAINLKPDSAEAHFNLGLVYYRVGQMEKARTELTAGLKIKPDDQRAQQLLKTVIKECEM